MGLADLEPITFAALRYVIGAASLLIYWLYRGGGEQRTISGNNAFLVLALGILLYAAVPAMQFIGLDQTEAVTFNFVFQAGIPLVLAASAGAILKEATTWWEWVGVALVVFGAWVFFPAAPTGADLRGVWLAALAAVAIGGSNLIQRQVLRAEGTSALEVTALSMTIGAAILGVLAILTEDRPSLDLRLVILLLVLGIVNTALAFFIWHYAIQTLRALHIGVIASTQLVFVPLLAVWFLDEAFGWRQTLGSLIVLGGIAVVHYSIAWAKERRSAPAGSRQRAH